MIDLTQLLLGMVILILTGLLTVIGIQVFLILREFRTTLVKTNKVLDDTGVISESVSRPVSMLSSLAFGVKGGAAIMKAITKGRNSEKKEDSE